MRNNFFLSRRALRLATFAALFMSSTAYATESLTIDVHRDPNCGCCKKWIQYLEVNGFTVIDHVEANMSVVKQDLGVVPRLSSCHTAVLNGKFIEGHVPAGQIISLGKNPDLVGIAVPGMQVGSPGMEVDGKQTGYQVIGLTKAGIDQAIAGYPVN